MPLLLQPRIVRKENPPKQGLKHWIHRAKEKPIVVRKENPPKQGLKHCCKENPPDNNKVRKENPPKQGLKQAVDMYLIDTFDEVRKENPPKQGLKPAHVLKVEYYIHCPKRKSTKTRIETMKNFEYGNYEKFKSEKKIHQNKD